MFPLKQKHSFAVDVNAKQVIEIDSIGALQSLVWKNDTYILGEGTNTIFTEDFNGQLIINRLSGIEIKESETGWHVYAAAGENWHKLVVKLIGLGIYGSENLALIPGSVGAAPVQNIGAYGVEVATFIDRVEVYDCKLHVQTTLSHEECEFAYRDSIFKRPAHWHWFITGVHFFFPKAWQAVLGYPDLASLASDATAEQIMSHVIKIRQQKLPDPARVPNAGSFFKNPVIPQADCQRLQADFPGIPVFLQANGECKLAAAWLIDKAGLKSLSVGGAAVHERQALVLVNRNNASGADILSLAEHIQTNVRERYGVELEPEVRLLNDYGLIYS
ncbi:MAG: UDP-N-acetylmuramate dehydrogenase [Aliidiomarina sp.]|uniref:UDP-N-acetylmuramate dehydrogenase n=1 Tax=Aliidiomarina sp. TaxID=1872439 RepID=UPI0025C6379C|nr:UDP-N-acetylmuramate dehydrogenase [Aliidiomarina sp.]MCH8502113.1 UDP-N-acetylmuramate dehydrogenase [Aliidiomarina sp.]